MHWFWNFSQCTFHSLNFFFLNYTGDDCIGCAKTGSGKTAAFALPILQKLSEDPYGIFCLVLTPTRELAFQISEQFSVLGKPIGVRVTVITGGLGNVNKLKYTIKLVLIIKLFAYIGLTVILSPLFKDIKSLT